MPAAALLSHCCITLMCLLRWTCAATILALPRQDVCVTFAEPVGLLIMRAASGESSKRALQLWRWMYYDHNWISSFQETLGRQNGLSHTFINLADSVASVDGGLLLQQVAAAQDGTKKLVFKLTEGEGAGEKGCGRLVLPACNAISLRQRQRGLAEQTNISIIVLLCAG
jgi:hypothetical protein